MSQAKRSNTKPRGLGAVAKSWRKTWPVGASTVALLSTSALGAAAVAPSIGSLVAGSASVEDIILSSIIVMTGVSGTMTLNLGIRLGATEAALDDMKNVNTHLASTVETLSDTVVSLREPLPSYELVADSPELWTRVKNVYRATNPSLRSEVDVEALEGGRVRYHVNPVALEIWRQRAQTTDIEILLCKGCRVEEEGVVSFRRNQYDTKQIGRLAVFLSHLINLPGVDSSRIKIFFSEKEAPDLKSIFLAHVSCGENMCRNAVILYSNSHLLEEHSRRQVAIYYEPEHIAEGEGRWRTLITGSSRWTIKQLLNCFNEHVPSYSSNSVPVIPKDMVFNPKAKRDYDDVVDDVVNGDHFTVHRATPTRTISADDASEAG